MNNYKWFENTECKYYPCHDIKRINCKFCFCPLYHMKDCGGNYSWIKNHGKLYKDCSKCTLPHTPEGHDMIVAKLSV